MELLVTKEMRADGREVLALPAFCALHSSGIEVDSVDARLIGYLILRTLAEGRLAQRIAIPDFAERLAMSKTAVRKHLADLCERGFIHVYRTIADDSGAEKEARMFEIDCKKLTKTGGTPLRETDTPPRQTDTPSYTNYIGSSREKNISVVSLGGASRDITGKVVMLRTPKKPPAVRQQSEQVSEVLARVQRTTEVKRTARVASAAAKPAHLLSQHEMQAVFDKITVANTPRIPRQVITGKEFGVLRKRLKEQAPANFADFVEWMLLFWHDTASKQGAAIRRRGELGKATELPKAPNFQTIAYRYPYLLKVYESYLANGTVTEERETETERKLKAAQAQIKQLSTSIQVLRRRPAPRSVAATRLAPAALDSGLPEWDDFAGDTNAQ